MLLRHYWIQTSLSNNPYKTQTPLHHPKPLPRGSLQFCEVSPPRRIQETQTHPLLFRSNSQSIHAKMQPHARLNSAMAKKLWNHMRVSFIMARKGLVSKRKLLMDLNLMIKRGKLFRKTFFNLTFQNHHHHPSRGLGRARARAGPQEYEFSCTNTPVFSARAKRKHYFPCITTVDEEEFDERFMIERSPLDSPVLDCEEEVVVVEVDEGRVDEEAEGFIRRFYEQLRLQRRLALLQYQEMEYREMLARGTN